MKTLWSFGDSYAHVFNPNNNQYLNQVAKHLGLNNSLHARSGCSVSYTSYTFNQVRHKIEDKDVVIVALTTPSRRWFYVIKEIKPYIPLTKDQLKAEEMYRRHLDNDLEANNTVLDFLYNLHYLTEQKNLHTIILPCFEDSRELLEEHVTKFPRFKIAKGSLCEDISKYELKPDFYKKWATSNQGLGGLDPRLNHMIMSNHYILAERLVDHIRNGTDIDIKNGYVRDAIGFDTEHDLIKRSYELVDESLWFN